MNSLNRIRFSIFVVANAFITLGWTTTTDDFSVGAQEPKTTRSIKAVDDDMHHFMEYVFEPNYKRLKAAMTAEPKDKQAWKAIKGDALTLAECANLLLARTPDEDAKEWLALSVAVRTHGGELYQAARKADYTIARKSYVNMLNKCNTCHKKFADGKHQLKP